MEKTEGNFAEQGGGNEGDSSHVSVGQLQNRSQQTTRIFEVITLIVSLCSTVALFSLPIIFHFVLENSASQTQSDGVLSTSTSSNTTGGGGNCHADFTWTVQSLSKAECTFSNGYPYATSAGVCSRYLRRCITGQDGDDIRVNTTPASQEALDQQISNLQTLLSNYPDCQTVAIPFLCQYYFPLKDCNSNSSNLYTTSREECLSISTSVCAVPWSLAISFGLANQLPDCSSLPSSINASTSDNTSSSSVGIQSTINITCSDEFYLVNNTCQPHCDRFMTFPTIASQTVIACEIVAVVIGLLACLLVVCFAVSTYKKVLTYSTVYLLFIIANYIFAALIVIISALDRTGLYCKSASLIESLQSSTSFCSLSGAVFHYVFVSMTVWWFIHITVFFYKVLFPFHARQIEKDRKHRYIFGITVIIGILAPLPAVIVALNTDGYTNVRFPPSICSPTSDMFFYSVTVVIDILICLGVCLLITIFWIIHTNQRFQSMFRKKKALSTAEKKIMIIFIFYTIFGVYTMIQTGITTAHADNLAEGIRDYFICESFGDPNRNCTKEDFQKYSHPYLLAVSFILLGFIPLTILNYVVNVRSTKLAIRRCLKVTTVRGTDSVNISTSQTASTSFGGNGASNIEQKSNHLTANNY